MPVQIGSVTSSDRLQQDGGPCTGKPAARWLPPRAGGTGGSGGGGGERASRLSPSVALKTALR